LLVGPKRRCVNATAYQFQLLILLIQAGP
jgi:hypothetical protein